MNSLTSPLTSSSSPLLSSRTRTSFRRPRFHLRSSSTPPNPGLLKSITNLLWGKSLPPQLLISTVRASWNAGWHLMMSQLAPSDSSGGYSRTTSKFRSDSDSFRRRSNKLHLYVGLPCPWAHRTLIVRALKGLEHAVLISVASPGMDGSWEFKEGGNLEEGRISGSLDNGANGCMNLKEVYRSRSGGYDGRATVPMLWDVERKDVVCNESYDIIELFNSGLNDVAENPSLDLAPATLKERIDEWNQIVYPAVNNGVYRCGFAQSQEAYDLAVNKLFDALDLLDTHLGGSRYLCGDVLTLGDVCLFTTLVRFDLVYNGLFKCTKKKLIEYTHLHEYMRDIYQIPKVAETCNFEAIMDGYYKILFPLNPGGIRPARPSDCEDETLFKPHNRHLISSSSRSIQVAA
ncbi:hypothetical protein QQ045_009257 [Rhodiola kirilowii]